MEHPSWTIAIDRNLIQAAVGRIALYLHDDIWDGQKPLLLCCILKGAVFFTVDLARSLTQLGVPYAMYFVEASSYKGQRQDELEILSVLQPSKFQDKQVVLLDELYDNGKTMHLVKKAIQETIGEEQRVTTCVLLCKKKPTRAYPLPDIIGIDNVPDEWLVGYGLDHHQQLRGLQDVYSIPKEQ